MTYGMPKRRAGMSLEIYHMDPDGKRFRTLAVWPPKDMPKATLENFMDSYCAALEDGGSCRRVAEFLGYTPTPYFALLNSARGKVLERWNRQVLIA